MFLFDRFSSQRETVFLHDTNYLHYNTYSSPLSSKYPSKFSGTRFIAACHLLLQRSCRHASDSFRKRGAALHSRCLFVVFLVALSDHGCASALLSIIIIARPSIKTTFLLSIICWRNAMHCEPQPQCASSWHCICICTVES